MRQIKFFAVASILALIQGSTSDNTLNQNERDPKESWFSNEIENIERNLNDPVREVLPFDKKYTDALLEYAIDLPENSNSIEMDSHVWRYRSSDQDKFASNSKMFKIYNRRGFLAVNKYGEVYANKSENSSEIKFKALLYSFQKNRYKVGLLNVKYSTYIAISCKTGKVYSTTKQQNPETILIYSPNAATGDTFQSEKCPQSSSNFWYLGIKKIGRKIKNARVASANDKGTRFLLVRI